MATKALFLDFERVIAVPGEVRESEGGALRFIPERGIAQRAAWMKLFFIFTRLAWTALTAYALYTLGMPKNLFELIPGVFLYFALINPFGLVSSFRALSWPCQLSSSDSSKYPSADVHSCGKRRYVVVEVKPDTIAVYTEKSHPKALAQSAFIQPILGAESYIQSSVLLLAALTVLGSINEADIFQKEELLGISILASFLFFILMIAGLLAIITASVKLNKLRNAISPGIAELEKLFARPLASSE